ncbi:MAG: endonuclease [Saprospiraceae bacterium]|nr:endonuclease [Saprospiraceae bacterium]
MTRIFIATAFLFFAFQSTSQTIFPALNGVELLNTLALHYKPVTVLPFNDARDTLFSRIYAHNDSLTCVYTGMTIYLNPALDPTVAAFGDGGVNGINTEHTYPQSKGAETGNPRADMHHLYPTRVEPNATRGDFPFSEIPDNQTEEWFYLNQKQTNIPTSNIARYSEYKDYVFEPREDHKGNVARAMFYFYTMYKAEADLADNAYFESQRLTLCNWHQLDPADQIELTRTWAIAGYQDGKPNPYVLDCTLARRAYCPGLPVECFSPTASRDLEKIEWFTLESNAPNPFERATDIRFHTSRACRVEIEVFDLTGRRITLLSNEHYVPGYYTIPFVNETGVSQMFLCRIIVTDGGKSWTGLRRMIAR